MILIDAIFGQRNAEPVNTVVNTVIVGTEGFIPTVESLAERLSITVNDIGFFEIVGKEVQAAINADYHILDAGFYLNTDIEKYFDYGNRCKGLNSASFRGASNLTEFQFDAVEYLGQNAFYDTNCEKYIFPNATICNIAGVFFACTSAKIIALPKVLNLGSNVSYDTIFLDVANAYIIANTSMQTINNGSPEGDLQYAESLGNKIIYHNVIDREAIPTAPTNLSIIESNSTSIKVSVISSSVNPIVKYKVFLDGIFNNEEEVTGMGDHFFIRWLTPNIQNNITIIAQDVLSNDSQPSEIFVVQTTLQPISINGLLNFYKLDDETGGVLDSYGESNGVNFGAIRGVSGVVNKQYQFTGANYATLGQPQGLLNDSTIGFWLYAAPDWLNRSCPIQYHHYTTWGSMNIFMERDRKIKFYYGKTTGGWTAFSTNLEIQLGQLHYITLVRDHTNKKYIIYMIRNKILYKHIEDVPSSITTSAVSPTGNFTIGSGYSGRIKGKMDEIPLYGRALSESEIMDLYNNGNGLTI